MLLVFACVFLISSVFSDAPNFLLTAAFVSAAIVLTLLIIVPRFNEKPPGRIVSVFIIVFGLLEIFGLYSAISGEVSTAKSLEVSAFDVPRSIFDVEHKFIVLPSGSRIHYVDKGSGQILLFLHGNPSWSFQWRDLIAGLCETNRCIAPDFPGFGFSTAPPEFGYTPIEQSLVLQEFIDQLDLREITFVMQDWGGPIGFSLAGRRPELVKRIVLGNTWAWKTDANSPRGIFSTIAGGPIGEFAQINFNGIATFALDQGVVKKLSDEKKEMYLRPFHPFNRRGIATFYPGQINAAEDFFNDVENGLEKIRSRPALIFWGLQDPGFPESEIEKFEQIFPDHKTIKFSEADHFFFEDTAPQVIDQIKVFLAQ